MILQLWICNVLSSGNLSHIAIEHGPVEIVVLPCFTHKKLPFSSIVHRFLYVCQRKSSTSHPFGFYLERLHMRPPLTDSVIR